jgi:calcineurin-like phosphoesterase family protein
MKRRFVIGDIHGGLAALKQVLDRASITKEDQLIFLGDYVDGWSDSASLIDYMMELSTHQSCIFIKGNHDCWCEEWLGDGTAPEEWLNHGGKETVDSYTAYNDEKKGEHLQFFRRMKLYFIDEVNRLFVHAGFSSMHGPGKEVYQSNFMWDRTLWEMALAFDNRLPVHSLFYPKRLRLFHEIFIGHTPTLNFMEKTPMHACNVWNIDTGAGFDGKLSIMNIDTKEFFQSDPLPQLYKGQKGRNKKWGAGLN